jgi:hypothetical protein
MGFESRQVIDQDNFVNTAEELLSSAESATGDIHQARANADEVVSRLAAVADGTLEVQPPLAEEQVSSYQKRADTIKAIANKAIAGLSETKSQTRQGSEGKKKGGRGFRGKGASAKS